MIVNEAKIFRSILMLDLKLPDELNTWMTDYIDQDTNLINIEYLQTEIQMRIDANKDLDKKDDVGEISFNKALIKQIKKLIIEMQTHNLDQIVLNQNI